MARKWQYIGQVVTLYSILQGVSDMGRMRENPRYNVISMRISDAERETLEQIMETTKKSVSDIMREAMELVKMRAYTADLSQKAA